MNLDHAYPATTKKDPKNSEDDLITGALSELVHNPDGFIYFYKLTRHLYHLRDTCRDMKVPFESDALYSIKQIPQPDATEEAVIMYLLKVVKILSMYNVYNRKVIIEYLRHTLPVERYNKVVIQATKDTPSYALRRTLGIVLIPVLLPVACLQKAVKLITSTS